MGQWVHRTFTAHQISKRGNSTRRLPDESLRLMSEIIEIESEYESVKQKSRISCWAMLKERCQQQAVPPPSYAHRMDAN
jgi:hypothetical protein